MKDRRDIAPYHYSDDWSINTSITMMKIYRRILDINPNFKRQSRFQQRIQRKRATCRLNQRSTR